MRKYLAPYLFRIKGVNLEDFYKALDSLKTDGFKDENQLVYIKVLDLFKNGSTIYGKIEHGSYGKERNVIDTDTQQYSNPISKGKSPLDKFFFYFYFMDTNSGIFISQRTGNIGIRTILADGLKNKQKGLTLRIDTIVMNFEKFKNKAIKKVTITVPQFPKEIEGKMLNNGWIENRDEIEVQYVLIANRGRTIISPRILDIVNVADKIHNKEVSYIGLIDPQEEMKVEFDIGDSDRTITLNTGKFRNWVEIDKDIEEIDDIKKEAILLKDNILSKIKVD